MPDCSSHSAVPIHLLRFLKSTINTFWLECWQQSTIRNQLMNNEIRWRATQWVYMQTALF